jgi:hypothetical protein
MQEYILLYYGNENSQINLKIYKNIHRIILMPEAECSRYEYKFAENFIKNNNQHKFPCVMDCG